MYNSFLTQVHVTIRTFEKGVPGHCAVGFGKTLQLSQYLQSKCGQHMKMF